jgi:FKBP-type peptidyl-prolyl cis-trans isomerase FklB
MKNWKYILLAVILFPLEGMVSSCSEDSEEEGDFDNWEMKNYIALDEWAAISSYRKILTFTKNANVTTTNDDYIYVEKLESVTENDDTTPLYTDTVRVAYRGHLIPTKSYPKGYVFDQTYLGDFTWETAGTADLAVSDVVDGFATALMHMRVGDSWRVHIPYLLGYGTSSTSSIPGYSNLVFEIALYDYWHPGEERPNFK